MAVNTEKSNDADAKPLVWLGGMEKSMKGIGRKVLVGMLALCSSVVFAQAGNINSAEQRVVDTVSQSFEYNGKVYKVTSENIANGKAKLSEDDVDLSEIEADSYIAQFHESYQELVEEGYCIEVSHGEKNTNLQKNNTTESVHSEKEQKQRKKFLNRVLGEPAKGIGEEQEIQVKDDKNVQKQETSATAVPDSSESEWLEEDLGEECAFTKKDIAGAKEGKVTINGTDQKVVIHSEQKNRGNVILNLFYFQWWKYYLAGLAVYSVLVGIGIGIYIIRIKGVRKRRKIRFGLAVMSGISIAGWCMTFMAVCSLYFGVFNENAVRRKMMESDYYSGMAQMVRTLAEEELSANGYQEEIAKEVFSLSSVYIEEKQYVDAVFSGKTKAEISTERIHEQLQKYICSKNEKADSALIRKLENIYQDSLQFEFGNLLRESRETFLAYFYLTSCCSVLFIGILLISIYKMYGYPHKAVRVGAAAMGASGVLVTGISLVLLVKHIEKGVKIVPVYYQEFIQKYILWDVRVALYVGIIGVLTAIGLFVWKRYLHMLYAA